MEDYGSTSSASTAVVSASAKEPSAPVRLANEILVDVLKLLSRKELGNKICLVNRRFMRLANDPFYVPNLYVSENVLEISHQREFFLPVAERKVYNEDDKTHEHLDLNLVITPAMSELFNATNYERFFTYPDDGETLSNPWYFRFREVLLSVFYAASAPIKSFIESQLKPTFEGRHLVHLSYINWGLINYYSKLFHIFSNFSKYSIYNYDRMDDEDENEDRNYGPIFAMPALFNCNEVRFINDKQFIVPPVQDIINWLHYYNGRIQTRDLFIMEQDNIDPETIHKVIEVAKKIFVAKCENVCVNFILSYHHICNKYDRSNHIHGIHDWTDVFNITNSSIRQQLVLKKSVSMRGEYQSECFQLRRHMISSAPERDWNYITISTTDLGYQEVGHQGHLASTHNECYT
ncbi:hypothetical protein Ddc_03797 [Ditylenchus destructor]|nr:hypothetical protein Ddc_03797 [Ditylenchus destructor]